MVGLIREGPKALLVEVGSLNEIRDYLLKNQDAREYDSESVFEYAGEGSTIMVLTDSIDDVLKGGSAKTRLVIKEEPDIVMARIINEGKTGLIRKIRISSRTIFMRAMGDMDKIFEEIKKDYEGTEAPFMDILKSHRDDGVIVALTEKPLNRDIQLKDIYKEKGLFINEGYYDMFKELRVHGLKYLNAGMQNNEWYELEFRIFDKYGAYKKHFERLIMVLEALELGIVLGHFWSKDYPRVLLAVDVYSVKFFTFFQPKSIKRILLGLEHLEDGTRIVDYDLFYKKEKLYWRSSVEDKNERREAASKRYRKEILSRLTENEINELLALEEEILKTRK